MYAVRSPSTADKVQNLFNQSLQILAAPRHTF
jgi:hypothetical protein